ncbi:MAG: DUF1190 domain-containing protein [Pseudomonadota bacterium]|nr:DUF1190 domain-containing protein [Pseudomonadota bacterium]
MIQDVTSAARRWWNSRKTLAGLGILLSCVASFDRTDEDETFVTEGQQKKFDLLDKGPWAVFTSVNDCTEQGFGLEECVASWKITLDTFRERLTAVRYHSAEACATKHRDCVPAFWLRIRVAGDFTSNETEILWSPPMEGWQVLKTYRDFQATDSFLDTGISVPIYRGLVENAGVRADDVTLPLQTAGGNQAVLQP